MNTPQRHAERIDSEQNSISTFTLTDTTMKFPPRFEMENIDPMQCPVVVVNELSNGGTVVYANYEAFEKEAIALMTKRLMQKCLLCFPMNAH